MKRILLILPAVLMVTFLPDILWQLSALFIITGYSLLNVTRQQVFSTAFKFWPIVVITLLFHLFLRFDSADYWGAFGQWTLWHNSLFFTTRNLNIIILMSHIITVLSVNDIATRLMQFDSRVSRKHQIVSGVIQPLIIGLRYYDSIRREYHSMRQLHRILGIEEKGRYLHRIRYYSGIVLPLILTAMEKSEQIGIALTTRAYPPRQD